MMNFLKQERAMLEELLPGLDAALAAIPLMDMERPGNPSIPIYRQLARLSQIGRLFLHATCPRLGFGAL
jgi:hypothetical protein